MRWLEREEEDREDDSTSWCLRRYDAELMVTVVAVRSAGCAPSKRGDEGVSSDRDRP